MKYMKNRVVLLFAFLQFFANNVYSVTYYEAKKIIDTAYDEHYSCYDESGELKWYCHIPDDEVSIIFVFFGGVVALVIVAILYIVIKTFIESLNNLRERFKTYGHLKRIGTYDIQSIWQQYGLISTFNKEALIVISKYLGVKPPKELTEQEFIKLSPVKEYRDSCEKLRYMDGIYSALSRRLNKGIYGEFYKSETDEWPFHCAPFIKQMLDWKDTYENLVKKGSVSEFLDKLNSIKIDLNVQDSAILYKPYIDDMTKSELIIYANEQGVKIKSKDTKAQIMEKIFFNKD
jgi:hypothetical protein